MFFEKRIDQRCFFFFVFRMMQTEITFPIFAEEKQLQRLIVAKKKHESKTKQLRIDVQKLTKHPNDILKDCIERINKYCEQGGHGFAFYYRLLDGNTCPHHWVIKPEFIDACILTSDEQIAIRYFRLYQHFSFVIAKSAATEIWGN